ncbi:TPA: hypothetical protein ACOFDH_000192 [Stenotrophomonas maltophilia]
MNIRAGYLARTCRCAAFPKVGKGEAPHPAQADNQHESPHRTHTHLRRNDSDSTG